MHSSQKVKNHSANFTFYRTKLKFGRSVIRFFHNGRHVDDFSNGFFSDGHSLISKLLNIYLNIATKFLYYSDSIKNKGDSGFVFSKEYESNIRNDRESR